MIAKVTIGTLHPDGIVTDARTIDPGRCPHFIMVPEHYRDGGACKCDDPAHTVMESWGYTWSETTLRREADDDGDR